MNFDDNFNPINSFYNCWNGGFNIKETPSPHQSKICFSLISGCHFRRVTLYQESKRIHHEIYCSAASSGGQENSVNRNTRIELPSRGELVCCLLRQCYIDLISQFWIFLNMCRKFLISRLVFFNSCFRNWMRWIQECFPAGVTFPNVIVTPGGGILDASDDGWQS